MRKSVLALVCCLLATAAYALSPGGMAEYPQCSNGLCPTKGIAEETDTVTLPVFDPAYGDLISDDVIDIFQPSLMDLIEVEVEVEVLVEAPVKQSCGAPVRSRACGSRARACGSRFFRVRRLFRGCR